jgi:transcriptional regulator with XRE-family HTH domain
VSLAAAVVDEVRRRMAARGMSARELARRAEMPATSLHRAMNGERALSIDELGAVAVVLEVTPEHLLRIARESLTRTPRSGDSSESNAALPQE